MQMNPSAGSLEKTHRKVTKTTGKAVDKNIHPSASNPQLRKKEKKKQKNKK